MSLLVWCSFSAHTVRLALIRPWTPEFLARLRVKLRGCKCHPDGATPMLPPRAAIQPPGRHRAQHRLPISSRVESTVAASSSMPSDIERMHSSALPVRCERRTP
ncbi:hypothetical protein BGZ57DRAFT_917635 [Hyaloscypha finlandica]|nr:hypothetical protein BGZ57DRAFT_917635 [Hyaloscypha finlandica]